MIVENNMNKTEILMDIIKCRTSCRSYTSEDVSEDDIRKIVDAGLWSPSGHNSQNVKIIRIKDEGIREALRLKTSYIMTRGYDFDPFYGAKELFVVLSYGDLSSYDGSLVMGNMMLACESLGLGCCWVNTAQYETMNDDSIIRKMANEMSINDGDVTGIGYLIVGHKNEVNIPKERKCGRYFEI